jgi:hypothetical protein
MGNQIAGMYPTLIIVIVNFRHTIWEEGTSADRISNSVSFSALPWSVRRPGLTGTFETQGGVDIRLDTVIGITHENLSGSMTDQNAKHQI